MMLKDNIELPYINIIKLSGSDKKTGKSKIIQLENWNKIALLNKIDTKFKVERMRTKEELNQYSYEDSSKNMAFMVRKEYKNKSGIYAIILDNNIYIGRTKNFMRRFSDHYQCGNQMITKSMLRNGGKFLVVELCDNLEEMKYLEKYYIKKYYRDDFWNCVNKRGAN